MSMADEVFAKRSRAGSTPRRTDRTTGVPRPQSGERVGRSGARVRRLGQQLWLGDDVFRVRGVTYGSFRPRRDDHLFPEPQVIRSDFAAIAALGLNTVRIYTAPPSDLLEAAREFDVKLLVGIQYDDWRMHPPEGRRTARAVLRAARTAVAECMARCAGCSDVLAVAVGNEVPADLVRLHGVESVEDVLAELVAEVHAADPGCLPPTATSRRRSTCTWKAGI
jgi:O-antigen biosynthesis protein